MTQIPNNDKHSSRILHRSHTHLLHELVIVVIAVHFPVAVESHGGAGAGGDEGEHGR